jgi:hypothetical protein
MPDEIHYMLMVPMGLVKDKVIARNPNRPHGDPTQQ